MDLEILEALALSNDRAAAVSQLLPGSEDHDYYSCLHCQHRNALDDAQKILDAWGSRHGHTERYQRLVERQRWCRLGENPASVADDVRDQFGVSHWHEAEVAEIDPKRPTKLAPGTFDGSKLLDEATGYANDLSQVTDDGIYELLDRDLTETRRRALLQRLAHTDQRELVELIAADLDVRGSNQFGTLTAHHALTLDQLRALEKRWPAVTTHRGWVEHVIYRIRPPQSVDIRIDRIAREAYLVELWKFVGPLPSVHNSLKAHVLWHLLDTIRCRDSKPAAALITEYLKLPRNVSYVSARQNRSEEYIHLGAEFSNTTGLPRAGDDEELIRDLLQRTAEPKLFEPWLERNWFEAEVAIAQLLSGTGNADKATLVLGPARAAELRERVELRWCAHNPTQIAANDPIVLEADVKHVPELLVKVFRIDPLAYYQIHRRSVNTDLDLDGLAASHELVMKHPEPAVRRVRRRIELPMCSRAGTYVIDLIGNGISSRAVVEKGRLRILTRTSAAGVVATVIDEAGQPRPEARAWLGDREYIADATGTFVVPFSTNPVATTILLSSGEIASVAGITLQAESYALAVRLLLDRQSLVDGTTSRAIARAYLTVQGVAASIALLEKTSWDVTLVDRHGISTTKSFPLTLSDDDAAVLEFPVGESTAFATVTVRGRVKVVSTQGEQDLVASTTTQLATMHQGLATEALYLARTAQGWVLSALGKTGEPRAQRPITVSLTHRWARTQLNVELATDAQGRCELGELPGIAQLQATLGSSSQTWSLLDAPEPNEHVHVAAGKDVVIPIPPSRTAAELLRRASLVELRSGLPVRHVKAELLPLAGAIAIRGLPPGEYGLRLLGFQRFVIRVATAGALVGRTVIVGHERTELSRPVPAIAELAVEGGALRARILNASSRTRVHVIATRFWTAPLPLQSPQLQTASYWVDPPQPIPYLSGRELGDEYRYVLERRNAKRFPTLQLDKPSLLLNPWARRETSTAHAVPATGRAFGAAGPGMAAAGYAGQMQTRQTSIDMYAYVGYDFVPQPPVVIANLVPADGAISVPLAELGRSTCVTIVVDDPAGTSRRQLSLAEAPLDPKDLRLRIALDPAQHATQKKQVAPLRPSDALVIEDLATARVHLVDSVERAHGYLLALRDDSTLRELTFITRWHTTADTERRELYSKFACHELHLFLYFKDRAFFDVVVRPYLVHKRVKTFIDHWLLDVDLTPWFEPSELAKLNAFERALLAQRLLAEPAVPRLLADEVAIQPPNPTLDTRIIDALLGGATLDQDTTIESFARTAVSNRMESELQLERGAPRDAAPMARPAPAPQAAAKPKMAKKSESRKRAMAPEETAADEKSIAGESLMEMDDLEGDVLRRADAAPMFRAADKTQEWAENNWWRRTPGESGAEMIQPNRLWRDLALHRTGAFLSPWLGLAANSFSEAMCALAVIDLPFVAGKHAINAEGARLTITAAANALAGSSQLVDGELVETGAPLVVGQSYVRTDDRHRWIDGEQVDKYVEGAFLAGIVYTCQIVLANPTSSRQRIAALVQIPRGSIPLAGARPTHTIDVVLEPYGTFGHEYAFYFPMPGEFPHFPVHVSRNGQIVAAAPGRTLAVTATAEVLDPHSWPHISQHGTVAEVTAFLTNANLAEIERERVAWRMRDRKAYDAILGELEKRRAYNETLWGYALMHRDKPRIRVWARSLGARLMSAGPVLDMPILGVDAETVQGGGYEHLEYAPVINARAHKLGSKQRILNDGFAAQYWRYLELVAHRRAPTSEDLLAGTAYLLAQDRYEAALAMLARVDASAIADRLQHDYLAAFASCLNGELGRAREAVARWRELPVDRWRRKFEAVGAMLGELDGAGPTIVDPKSREQQQSDLAAKQPAFDIAVDRDGVVIRQQHVGAIELRFFEMDVELLFSRQPFVQSDVSRFSFIEPGHREYLETPAAEHRLAWPDSLRGKNVVVEAVGGGMRRAKIHYANDLATNLSHQYGQIRVQRASDRGAIPSTYVKVYAQKRGGQIAFYKDGYTDLRGWFDYASLSTNDLDVVEKFAILVCSDRSGSAILEAGPPAR